MIIFIIYKEVVLTSPAMDLDKLDLLQGDFIDDLCFFKELKKYCRAGEKRVSEKAKAKGG